MSDFGGMEDLLQDFLVEAGDLLSGVDNKLVDLERTPNDKGLLNDIFRGFHTIKGGAGFLNAAELVTLCHLTENLFDKLRNGELAITPEVMDVILSSTGSVRDMFGYLEQGVQPTAADPYLIESLRQAIAGNLSSGHAAPAPAPVVSATPVVQKMAPAAPASADGLDWNVLFESVTGSASAVAPVAVAPVTIEAAPPLPMHQTNEDLASKSPEQIIKAAVGRRVTDKPGASGPIGRRESEKQRDNSIRVDTSRLDQVLNLSGEIGLTKNRLNALRSDILNGRSDTETLHALDLAV
ncbi:Hpt domain-containing protein, partial [Zoogloea sp.]|uniref:Hpt domain-containing protein n=1 Tax=Zoogloea sp. TaxID=49181 RepID=UPI00258E24D5